MAELIAVTGVTGTVGGQVARGLVAAGRTIRMVGRDPGRFPRLPGERAHAPSYRDTAAMTAALRGADAMLLVSAREDADRMVDHRSAVDAAVAAGVAHIVYTSFDGAGPDCTFTFGRDHWHTEQYIRASGLGFTFLRDNFYLSMLPLLADADGIIRGPAGTGRLAAVDQADVAAMAVQALAQPGHVNQTYRLTGPRAFSLAEAAELLTQATGRPVRYEDESLEQAYASRAHFGAPAFEVDGWVSTYVAIARGELETLSPDIAAVLGRPPASIEQFLAENPGSYAHLRGQ